MKTEGRIREINDLATRERTVDGMKVTLFLAEAFSDLTLALTDISTGQYGRFK